MKLVVYVDVLLLVNFVIGAAMLLCTALLCGRALRTPQLLAASVVAALLALSIFLPELPWPAQLAGKGAVAALVVRIAFGKMARALWLKAATWYFLLNLMLAGAVMLGAQRAVGMVMEANNLTVYLSVSPVLLLVCILLVYGLFFLLERLCFLPRQEAVFTLTFFLWENSICLKAFVDTGCKAQDLLMRRPLFFAEESSILEQLPQEIRIQVHTAFRAKQPSEQFRFWLLPCNTVAGQQALPVVPITDVRLEANRKTYTFPAGSLAIYTQTTPAEIPAFFGTDILSQWEETT